jgi:hypothetical protein
VSDTGGALQLDFNGSGDAYCGVDSNDTFAVRVRFDRLSVD